MIKRISLLFSIFFLFCSSIGHARESVIHCSRELTGILEKIQTLPEGNELIAKVLERGSISIEINYDYPEKFDGYWSSTDRTIYITKKKDSSQCFLITALLFELHNALRTADLEEMYSLAASQEVEREEFIESVEYIEYENALSTSMLLAQGSAYDIFPCDCGWELSDNFPEHLDIQRQGGHSALIGKIYDDLTCAL